MKFRFTCIAAALFCCLSCVEIDYTLGSNLIPESDQYSIVPAQKFPLDVTMKPTDSLSGFSNLRLTIGAVRDEKFGLTKRACVIRLVPLDTMRFGDEGTKPVFKSFHFAAAFDTVSFDNRSEARIFQTANVYALKEPVSVKYDYDACGDVSSKIDRSRRISISRPILDGSDSLSFDFTEEFGKKFFEATKEERQDYDKFISHFPGIYIEVDDPVGIGGRINMFEEQLSFDPDYYTLTGNYAALSFRGTFNGTVKDTSIFFSYSMDGLYSADELIQIGAGQLPQYSLNLCSHDKTSQGYVSGDRERYYLEGGAGLKPVISARFLRDNMMKIIKDSLSAHGRNLADTANVVIAKASLVYPFEAPDVDFKGMFKYPEILSPSVRMHVKDTTEGVEVMKVEYCSIADASNANENQGNINRSLMQYSPDITYHAQELVSLNFASGNETDRNKVRKYLNGEYDVWLMAMANEVITTTTMQDSEVSDYYNYLAYQSYYNSIYGGYGGYGGYGYGDPYSNYYSYMMAAMYAGGSSTSSSTSQMLDKDRFYKVVLCGPEHPDASRRPVLNFSFAFPNE